MEKRLRSVLCWLFRHRLVSVRKSPSGVLEQVFCRRCKGVFAMHHGVQWFGPWDHEDEESMKMLMECEQ